MATAVFFHAHPDDEAIQTGGTMARMAADGHRVVLITATRGELGEVPDGLLAPGETLSQRRGVDEADAQGAGIGADLLAERSIRRGRVVPRQRIGARDEVEDRRIRAA